ncbi:hypothetical protein DM992_25045 [Burkholderia sp. JP2-270]|nr:hypothetical protein DM992_25045 [Burkholderia sp. JP2-270]
MDLGGCARAATGLSKNAFLAQNGRYTVTVLNARSRSAVPAFVLIGLGLVLVAMFAAGFYWLATMDRPIPPHSQ